jgi:hypothetical protein
MTTETKVQETKKETKKFLLPNEGIFKNIYKNTKSLKLFNPFFLRDFHILYY